MSWSVTCGASTVRKFDAIPTSAITFLRCGLMFNRANGLDRTVAITQGSTSKSIPISSAHDYSNIDDFLKLLMLVEDGVVLIT